MIHQIQPKNFDFRFEIVSCFVEYDGKILLLHRQDRKPEGNTWGVPAGKVDSGENCLIAMSREMAEETAIKVSTDKLKYFKKVYVRYPTYDFIHHIFHVKLTKKCDVKINPIEHKNFQWISPNNALNIDLIQDLDACIKIFFDCEEE